MARYEILDGETVINTIIAEKDFVDEHYPGSYRLLEEPVVPEPRKILYTQEEMRAKFTRAELMAITSLAKTDVGAEVFLDDLKTRTMFDITEQDFIDGIDNLVDNDALTQERADVILA